MFEAFWSDRVLFCMGRCLTSSNEVRCYSVGANASNLLKLYGDSCVSWLFQLEHRLWQATSLNQLKKTIWSAGIYINGMFLDFLDKINYPVSKCYSWRWSGLCLVLWKFRIMTVHFADFFSTAAEGYNKHLSTSVKTTLGNANLNINFWHQGFYEFIFFKSLLPSLPLQISLQMNFWIFSSEETETQTLSPCISKWPDMLSLVKQVL